MMALGGLAPENTDGVLGAPIPDIMGGIGAVNNVNLTFHDDINLGLAKWFDEWTIKVFYESEEVIDEF